MRKLDIGAVLRKSFALLFNKQVLPGAVGVWFVPPLLWEVAIQYIPSFAYPTDPGGETIMSFLVLDFLFCIPLFVNVHRHVLLAEQPAGGQYMLYLLRVGLIGLLGAAAFLAACVLGGIALFIAHDEFLIQTIVGMPALDFMVLAALVLAMPPMLMLLAPAWLLLPAAATASPLSLRQAFAAAKGNRMRLALLFIVANILMLLLAFVFLFIVFFVNRYARADNPTLLSAALAGMVLTARDICLSIVWAGMLTIAYQQLVPQPDRTAEVFA